MIYFILFLVSGQVYFTFFQFRCIHLSFLPPLPSFPDEPLFYKELIVRQEGGLSEVSAIGTSPSSKCKPVLQSAAKLYLKFVTEWTQKGLFSPAGFDQGGQLERQLAFFTVAGMGLGSKFLLNNRLILQRSIYHCWAGPAQSHGLFCFLYCQAGKELGDAWKAGRDTAESGDPNWPKGYSRQYGIMVGT